MKQPANTSWAIVSAALIGLVGTVIVEIIKRPDLTATQQSLIPVANFDIVDTRSKITKIKERELPPIPELEKTWHVESYQTSEGRPLNIRYRMGIRQNGNELDIVGVKIAEVLGGIHKDYSVSEQKPCNLKGSLFQNSEGQWEMTLTGYEGSQSRGQMNMEAHVYLSDGRSQGIFGNPGTSVSSGAVWIPDSHFSEYGWPEDGRLKFGR